MRPNLPSGTVTFLFTDVEGSTKLLHELGEEAYADLLAEHRRLLRAACVSRGGVEVDTQGDAFFFAFPSALGALAAAGEATEALASGRIQVRMGLHSGRPFVTAEGYVGEDVHRAARIAAAAHGGQVVLSEATRSLLGDGAALRDLGEHRFKDLAAPERVYQHGDGEFPPLKSLYRTNLPVPASSFLGRDSELEELQGLLGAGDVRLLTLTGPGGTGKTRLALQAAAEAADLFPDGLWWVPLAPLRDRGLGISAVAQALEVKEEPGRELGDALVEHLGGKRALVLLDNAEHLLPGLANDLSPIVRDTRTTVWLVTSRERLQVSGEHAYPVPTLERETAVELFLERAGAAGSSVGSSDPVRELCARLDDLPLALELAAARTVIFSPEQLLERLSQRLDLFKGGRDADPRQQTLRATIEWSYELLDPGERRLFRSLSVFAGGCTYDAAEEICEADPDALQSLLDKSLLRRRDSELGPRFWMLETIREFAASQLVATEELESLRNRHLAWVAVETYARARRVRSYDPEALAFMRIEQANIRQALNFAVEIEAAESAQQILVGTWFYWMVGGLASEGDEWATRVVSLPSAPTVLYGDALATAGEFPRSRGDPERALLLKERAIACFEQAGPQEPRSQITLAATHTDVSDVLTRLGDFDRAAEHAERGLSIRRLLGDPSGIAHAVGGLALVAERRGAPNEALRLWEECVSLLVEAGEPLETGWALIGIACARRSLGNFAGASTALEEALQRSLESGDRQLRANAIGVLGLVAADAGDLARAVRLLSQATAEAREAGLALDAAGEVEAALASCRAALGDEPYEAAYSGGLRDAVSGSP